MKKLIVNADDYGPEKGIRDAVLKGYEEEILSSTSALVNFDDFAEYVRPLVDRQIPCGIHLNIFSGRPCTVENFADMGTPSLLRSEFGAQLDRLLASGAHVTHIDVHRPEVYTDLGRLKVVIDLAHAYKLPMRMPFRTFPEGDLRVLGEKARMDSEKLERMRAEAESYVVARSVVCPDRFIPVFLVSEPTEEGYTKLLRTLPDGCGEVCLHPNFSNERGMKEYNLLKRFNRERLKQEFAIELVNYSDLPR